MAKKTTKKKKAAPVITEREQFAREQSASLERAVRRERRVKALTRSLAKMCQRNDLDLVSLSAFIANRAGYRLEKVPASS
jgi:hypothetical protein